MFDSLMCRYDIIFGRDFLSLAGFWFMFNNGTVEWMGAKIYMKPPDYFNRETMMVDQALFLEWLDKMFLMVSKDDENSELFEASQMMQSHAYSAVTTEEVVRQQDHLDDKQKRKLKEVLDQHTVLFDGKLGRYPHKKFKIEVQEGREPKCQQPYPIPYRHKKMFAEEIDKMIKDGILRRRTTGSKWNSPTFCTPKKNN